MKIAVTNCVPHYPEYLGGWNMNIIPTKLKTTTLLDIALLAFTIIKDIHDADICGKELIQEPSEW